jgi:hypothetical protein
MRRYFAAFFLLAVASASADTYDLFNLLMHTGGVPTCTTATGLRGCFVVGDKLFVFDAATLSGQGIFTPTPPLALGQFSVSDITTGNLFGFEIGGSLSATATGTGTSEVDLHLGYTVETTNGQALMTDLHAALNGTCTTFAPNGYCQVQASETAANAAGGTVGGVAVGDNVLVTDPLLVTLFPDHNSPVTDLFVSNQSKIRVTKDILVSALGLNDGAAIKASLSVIDQYVSQVPEPGFYGALALGLSGLMLVRRRRRAA